METQTIETGNEERADEPAESAPAESAEPDESQAGAGDEAVETSEESAGESADAAGESKDEAKEGDAGDSYEKLAEHGDPVEYSDLIGRLLNSTGPQAPLAPGMLIYLDMDAGFSQKTTHRGKLKTHVLGYRDKHLVLCSTPLINGRRAQGYRGQELVARFIRDGVAYGFYTSLLYSLAAPFHVWLLKFPVEFETVELRTDRRFQMMIPAVVKWDKNEQKGVVSDLSIGGAMVFCDLPPENGTEVTISFGPVGTYNVESVPAVAQNVVRKENGAQVGLRFASESGGQVDQIRSLLDDLFHGIAGAPTIA